MDRLPQDRNSLRKFGVTMALAFLLISLVIFLRHRGCILPFFLISAIFLILALTIPLALKPIYILWMNTASVLGLVNTRLILVLIFYFVFTPVGLAIKLFGIDLLDIKFDNIKCSYWIKRPKKDFNPKDYERQF